MQKISTHEATTERMQGHGRTSTRCSLEVGTTAHELNTKRMWNGTRDAREKGAWDMAAISAHSVTQHKRHCSKLAHK